MTMAIQLQNLMMTFGVDLFVADASRHLSLEPVS